MILQLALIVIGFAVLSKSADEAIKHLVKVARHFDVSEFAVSFLVVGVLAVFPELSLGVNSALQGVPSFGLGIVLSSNIADLTIVLGTVALMSGGLRPGKIVAGDVKWFLIAAALPAILLIDGELSRLDGLILFAAFIVYVSAMLRQKLDGEGPSKDSKCNIWREISIGLVCIGALILAGKVITDAAEEVSRGLSVPLFYIGTILAIGTCLPELAFAVKAANARHADLGLGNVLGNVLADCMGTLGVIAIISPIRPEFPQLAVFDGVLMAAAMLSAAIIFTFRKEMTRRQGAVFILMYVLFLALQTFAEAAVTAGR